MGSDKKETGFYISWRSRLGISCLVLLCIFRLKIKRIDNPDLLRFTMSETRSRCTVRFSPTYLMKIVLFGLDFTVKLYFTFLMIIAVVYNPSPFYFLYDEPP